MFRIGIAEDDPSFQKTISEYIERYQKEKNIDIQASFFQDGNELVFKYEPIYDVLLLDIEMPKMNGMDAAREIMNEVKKGDLERVTFRNEQLRKYFPRSYTTQQMQDTIIKLLD